MTAETKLILQDDVVPGFTGFVPEPPDIQKKKKIHEKALLEPDNLAVVFVCF